MKINLDYIKKFNPCKSGVETFIKAGYENFNGSIIDFIKLDKISFSDIKWVLFHEKQKLLSDNLMREFALLCSLRAIESVNVREITYLYEIELLEYISGEKCDSAAYSAAYYAAYYAAYSAADSAARSAARYAARYAAHSAADSTAYYAAYSAARSAAYSAADSAARSAADSTAYSAEENIQKEILIDLIENGLVIMPKRK